MPSVPKAKPKRHPLHDVYKGMIARCHKEYATSYKYYGARGIQVCEGWRSDKQAFYDQMSPRPIGSSLDRIDNDAHYSCGNCEHCKANGWESNCRWSQQSQQIRNSRIPNVNHEYKGKSGLTVDHFNEFGAADGVNYLLLKSRIGKGWCIKHALETPKGVIRDYTCKLCPEYKRKENLVMYGGRLDTFTGHTGDQIHANRAMRRWRDGWTVEDAIEIPPTRN